MSTLPTANTTALELQGVPATKPQLPGQPEPKGFLSKAALSRIFATLSVASFVGVITVCKLSTHTIPQLCLIRSTSSIILSFIMMRIRNIYIYTDNKNLNKQAFIRALLAAVTFISSIYGTKYLKSSTFAVISRTKVFISLVLTALFNSDVIDVRLIIFTVISLIGVTLVVDSSIFGLGKGSEIDGLRDDDPAAILYYQNQAIGMLYCFVYVVANAFNKFFETIYTIGLNMSMQFFMTDSAVLFLASIPLMSDPMYIKEGEMTTYLLLPLFTAGQKYFTYRSYECGINFAQFIFIQGSIVVATFYIDVKIFGRDYSIWNIIGGILVVISAGVSAVYYKI